MNVIRGVARFGFGFGFGKGDFDSITSVLLTPPPRFEGPVQDFVEQQQYAEPHGAI